MFFNLHVRLSLAPLSSVYLLRRSFFVDTWISWLLRASNNYVLTLQFPMRSHLNSSGKCSGSEAAWPYIKVVQPIIIPKNEGRNGFNETVMYLTTKEHRVKRDVRKRKKHSTILKAIEDLRWGFRWDFLAMKWIYHEYLQVDITKVLTF